MKLSSELTSRILVAFFIVPGSFVFIFVDSPVVIIPLYVTMVAIMARELYRLVLIPVGNGSVSPEIQPAQAHQGNPRLGIAFILIGALLVAFSVTGEIDFGSEGKIILPLMLLEFLVFSLISIFWDRDFSYSFRNQQIHLFLFFYLNFIFLHILKLKYFFTGSLEDLGNFYLLLAFVICWFFDSGAYLFGRRWGDKKIGLGVSPKKSWVGLIAGFLFTFIAGALVSWILQKLNPELWNRSFFAESYLPWLLYPILGIVAQWGDLIASLHKRSSGVKDTGSLFKGHGGFYDRSDSVILVAVVLYYFVSYYHS